MEIETKDRKLKEALTDDAARKKRFGTDMAKKIQLRLAALRAAECLADFWPPNSGPERCHELKGDRKGQFSIDLKHPYRLVFIPIEDAPPEDRADEQKRWAAIKKIEILSVEDTHG